MIRFVLVVATVIAGTLFSGVVPASAQDSFQSMMEADVKAVETKLGLSGDQLKQVDAILQDGVKQRMAVLNSLHVVYGQRPSFGTLLTLQSKMDDIGTEQQTALSKILSEQQMFVVEQMAHDAQQRFRSALLGS